MCAETKRHFCARRLLDWFALTLIRDTMQPVRILALIWRIRSIWFVFCSFGIYMCFDFVLCGIRTESSRGKTFHLNSLHSHFAAALETIIVTIEFVSMCPLSSGQTKCTQIGANTYFIGTNHFKAYNWIQHCFLPASPSSLDSMSIQKYCSHRPVSPSLIVAIIDVCLCAKHEFSNIIIINCCVCSSWSSKTEKELEQSIQISNCAFTHSLIDWKIYSALKL